MGELRDPLMKGLRDLEAVGYLKGLPKEPPGGFSKNRIAEEVVGLRRVDAIPFDQPYGLGYHCPVCQYSHLNPDGQYDERLFWSEYESCVWCSVCNVDYPSCLCLPAGSARAIDVFLNSIRDAITRHTAIEKQAE